jgi:dihydropyrimidinase
MSTCGLASLFIKNGKIVTSTEAFEADIMVEEGVIARVTRSGSPPSSTDRVIDARGMYILPGCIDGHTHFEMPFMGTTTADDFYSGTMCCAGGGVTTIFDFAIQQKGGGLVEAVESWKKKAEDKAIVDYGFHLIVRDLSGTQLIEVSDVTSWGVTSFKVFTTYRKEELMLEDGEIVRLMKRVGELGGLVAVHAENNGLIESNVRKFKEEGRLSALYHRLSRPQEVEEEAVQRAVYFSKISSCPTYIVHLSSAKGRDAVRLSQLHGIPVFAETCPHYLVFDDSVYSRPDASNFVMSPPIKGKEDRASLWEGLREGDIKTVASDHADFDSAQKGLGKDDFTKIPNGVSGTEVILPILFSEGYKKGRLSLNRVVQVTSTNAAKAYNVFPQKGTINVGSDADIVIVNPDMKVRLTKENLHSKIDYSIYEDYVTDGYPVLTISRGDIVMEEGQITARQGRGRLIRRVPYKPHLCALFDA